jgi:hypothetical protein
MTCFSREALGQLDNGLSDAMTFPGPDRQRQKLWENQSGRGEVFAKIERPLPKYGPARLFPGDGQNARFAARGFLLTRAPGQKPFQRRKSGV